LDEEKTAEAIYLKELDRAKQNTNEGDTSKIAPQNKEESTI